MSDDAPEAGKRELRMKSLPCAQHPDHEGDCDEGGAGHDMCTERSAQGEWCPLNAGHALPHAWDRPGPRLREPTIREAFIRDTVGAEVRRAADAVGAPAIADSFLAALPQMADTMTRVEVWWWRGNAVVANFYDLANVANVLRGPGAAEGDYVPDGILPPGAGYELEVAVYFAMTDRSLFAVKGARGAREITGAVDAMMGVRRFPPFGLGVDQPLVERLTRVIFRALGGPVLNIAVAGRIADSMVRTAGPDGCVRLDAVHDHVGLDVETVLKPAFCAVVLSFEGRSTFFPTCPLCGERWGEETETAAESEAVRPGAEICAACQTSTLGLPPRVGIALRLPTAEL